MCAVPVSEVPQDKKPGPETELPAQPADIQNIRQQAASNDGELAGGRGRPATDVPTDAALTGDDDRNG